MGRLLGFRAHVRPPPLAGVGSGGHRELPDRPGRWHTVLLPVSLPPLSIHLASTSPGCSQSPCEGWSEGGQPQQRLLTGPCQHILLSAGSQLLSPAPGMVCHWALPLRTYPEAQAWPTSQPSASPSRSPWPSTSAAVLSDILLGRGPWGCSESLGEAERGASCLRSSVGWRWAPAAMRRKPDTAAVGAEDDSSCGNLVGWELLSPPLNE